MARNRKRAKERRARHPQPAATNARVDRGAPDPIAHATPDSELAEAQLALGRPELAPDAPALGPDSPGPAADSSELAADSPGSASRDEADAVAPAPDEEQHQPTSGRPRGGYVGRPGEEDLGLHGDGEDGGAQHPVVAPPQSGNRLINFVQGSWRELQRVQWPDRRQVMQATGVVIGFVIVAGIYLGVADWVAGKIVSLIIK